MFEFKVFRNGNYLYNVEIGKSGGQWRPLKSMDIVAGDILESVSDGVKLKVIRHNPQGYLYQGLELIEES